MNLGVSRSEVLAAWSLRLALLAITAAFFSAQHFAAAREGQAAGVALTYEAGSGALLKGEGNSLHRSSDQGQTWNPVSLPVPADGTVEAIATAAGATDTFYVAGPGVGVLRTQDGGESWVALNEGLPSRNVTALASHADQPETIYAYLPDSGIYRSRDAGESWQLMDRGPEEIRQLIHTNMEGSMETGWLYAATAEGARVSMDCFCLWRPAGKLEGEVYSLTYHPRQPKQLHAATEHGVFRSTDGGQNWTKAASPEEPAVALTVTPAGVLYAASSAGALFRTVDQSERWKRVGG